jgi:DNA-binding CsgD family transcriptional regulator/tetratricopeptide (TPR) repeat protein
VDEYFAGRAAELVTLDGLLRKAVAGHGQLGVILGPGWIGKTALIQQFLDDREVRVRWVCADRDETGLPGGLLEQFGLPAAGHDADPLRAGSALLAKLRQWAGAPGASGALSAPGAVLVVDDAQWGDPLSLRALSYALRRLPDTPLLALLAVRDDEFASLPPGLVRLISDRGTRLEVTGFRLAEIRSLAEQVGVGPVPPRAARRLLEHTGGVPQYVREVLQAVPRESLRTMLAAPDLLLPSPKSLEARVLTWLAGCSGPARHLVAAAAVLGTRCRLADAAALADLADPLPALEEAIGAGLLAEAPAVDGRCCEFPHASVRAAVYGCIGVAQRAALHRQAARRAAGPQALTHRVAACGGTDTALARELAARARVDRAAGRLAQASDLSLAALRVADRGAERDRLLQTAAGLLLDLGEAAAAGGLAAEVAATAPSAARSLLLGRLAIAARDPGGARRWLTDAGLTGTWRAGGARAAGEDGEDGDDVAAAVGEFALLLLARGRTAEAAAWARRAAATASTGVTRAVAQVIAAECAARDGQPGLALTALRAELGRQDPDDPGGPVLRAGLGTILFWCDELPAAAGHLAAAEAAPDAAAMPIQAQRQLHAASARRALADYRMGAWDEAADRANGLVTLAADLDQDSLLCGAHAAAVYPAAGRGQWDTARTHADAAARYAVAGDRDQLLEVAGARVALAFAMDDPEALLAAARPVVFDLAGGTDSVDSTGEADLAGEAGLAGFSAAEPALLGCWPLYAHALARVGRLAEAADVLAPFAELARARGRRSAIAAAARVEGFIHAAAGRPDAARRAYQVALASLDGLCTPHEEALTRLDYGRFLRHQSHRREALRELYAARAAFARLGAVPFVARCDAELGHEVPATPATRAATSAESAANAQLSAPTVRAVPIWPAPLTARQLAVARAVAEGKSNRQVARELYITVKTVEYHLSQIFAKLGIDGRDDIAGVLR